MALPSLENFPKNVNAAVGLIRKEVDRLDSRAASEIKSLVETLVEDLQREVTGRSAVDDFRRQLTIKALDRIDVTLDDFTARYAGILEGIQEETGNAGVDMVRSRTVARGKFAEISTSPLFNPINVSRMEALASLRTDLISGIGLESKELIRKTIQRGVLTGESAADVADLIADGIASSGFQGNILAKATTIARTETIRAYNTGHQIATNRLAEAIPDLRKRWVSFIDGRTRPTHIAANNTVIPYRDRFKIGFVELLFPVDPAGIGSSQDLARETISCRCTMVVVFPDER